MKFLKNNFKVIIAFILGLVLAGGIVYAAVSASEIEYKNGKSVEQALNELYGKTESSTLLWENQSPTSTFDAQTIPLNLSGYDYVFIIAERQNNSDDKPRSNLLLKVGEDYTTGHPSVGCTSSIGNRYCWINSTGVEFSTGYWGTGTDNRVAIPLYIYGIKSNLEFHIVD